MIILFVIPIALIVIGIISKQEQTEINNENDRDIEVIYHK